MTHETVDGMLKAYRFELGRCGHLMAEIRALQREIVQINNDVATAMASPQPQQITDMPRGTSVGNPTERLGLMFADGFAAPEARELEKKCVELQAEYDERSDVVAHVAAWLNGLSDRERWVVEAQVIDGMIWREVVSRYTAQFGESYSKDTIKRIRDAALDKIYIMAE